jgi:hypothetical protein
MYLFMYIIVQHDAWVTRLVQPMEQEVPPIRSTLVHPRLFLGVRVPQSLSFCVAFMDGCVSFCTYSFWPLYYLSFVDLRLLISLRYLRFTASDYPIPKGNQKP